MFVSQPLFGLPSQSRKLPVHVGTQAPAVQVVEPFGLTQPFPQEPQLVRLDCRLVSQPFTGLPSQLAQPAPQVGEHVPKLHVVEPHEFVHATLQAPQLSRSVLVFVSQPLIALPSQFAEPPLQTGVHVPPTQLVVPFGLRHTRPHWPQWFVVVLRFVSHPLFGLPSQSAKPALHDGTQAPAVQLVVPLAFTHGALQLPQWLALVFVSTSHPLVAMPSQLARPALQIGWQLPLVHVVEPPGFEHAVPQVPQLLVLVLVLVSQPLFALPSQSPKPALHAMPHVPLVQTGVPFVPLQTLPQPPQWAEFVFRLISQPSPGAPLQSLKPGEHEVT